MEYIRVGWISSGYVERHQLNPWLTVCQMKTQPSLMFGRVKNFFQKLTFWFWFTAHWGLSRPSREENLATEKKVSAAAFLQSQPPAIIVFIGKALRRGRFFQWETVTPGESWWESTLPDFGTTRHLMGIQTCKFPPYQSIIHKCWHTMHTSFCVWLLSLFFDVFSIFAEICFKNTFWSSLNVLFDIVPKNDIIFTKTDGSRQIGPQTVGPRTAGPRTVGPLESWDQDRCWSPTVCFPSRTIGFFAQKSG